MKTYKQNRFDFEEVVDRMFNCFLTPEETREYIRNYVIETFTNILTSPETKSLCLDTKEDQQAFMKLCFSKADRKAFIKSGNLPDVIGLESLLLPPRVKE